MRNNDSITNTRYDPIKAHQIIYSIFSNIKFLYEKTDNTFLDKYFSIYKLEQGYERYKICFKYLKNEYAFIMNILNNLLKSKYISLEKKLLYSIFFIQIKSQLTSIHLFLYYYFFKKIFF